MQRFLLRPVEAARVLSIGRSKLYELLASGRLASVTIDGCRRIRIEDLESFVASLEPTQTSASHPLRSVDEGDKPSGVIDLRDDQLHQFPDAPNSGVRT